MRVYQILKREDYDLLICEHKDRLTRFGFHYLETLLERCGIQIVVINQMDTCLLYTSDAADE